MEFSRAYDSQALLKLVEAYFSDNQQDSRFAEAILLEKTISGKNFVGVLNEWEMKYQGKIKEDLIKLGFRLEELQKENDLLKHDYQGLSLSYSQLEDYVEKYSPMINTIVSILEKTARDEAKTLIKQIENKFKNTSE